MRHCLRLAVAGVLFLPGLTAMAQPKPAPLPVPSELHALLVPQGKRPHVHLEWSAPNGPWVYHVYRSVDQSSAFVSLDRTNERRFDDFLVSPGHTYYYAIATAARRGPANEESARSPVDSAFYPATSGVPTGIVEGMVRDDADGQPVRGTSIQFFRRPFDGRGFFQTWTDSLGRYRATLDTGEYLIHAIPWGLPFSGSALVAEWYQDARSPAEATPVPVREGSSQTIDFRLGREANPLMMFISGTVRDSVGAPVPSARVLVLRALQSMEEHPGFPPGNASSTMGEVEDAGVFRGIVWTGVTDSLGTYMANVASGHPYIVVAVKKSYQPQFFDHKDRPDEANVLQPSGDTSGIDFTLRPLPVINNTVSGNVQDSSGLGVESRIVLVSAHSMQRPPAARFVSTDSTGTFSFEHVPSGSYYALAIPYDGYAPAWYQAGAFGTMSWKDADTIAVDGSVHDITIGVVPVVRFGIITVEGTVTSGGGGEVAIPGSPSPAFAPVQGANVYLADASGVLVGYGMTDQRGMYSITGVPSGSFLLTAARDGFSMETKQVAVDPTVYSVMVQEVTLASQRVTAINGTVQAPARFALMQNWPNPCNPSTTIAYQVGAGSRQPARTTDVRSGGYAEGSRQKESAGVQVKLAVYDLLGREVAVLVDGYQAPGEHRVVFNGKDLASGVYFYRLDAGGQRLSRKLVLLR